MLKSFGYAAKHSDSRLKPMAFERDPAGPHEIEIDVLFCGVCHSDIHQVKNEYSNTVYPCMPGHEVVGRVTRVGAHVIDMASLRHDMAAEAEAEAAV
jgi:uncharacterized zinc-type alcohol dehydrogenase-like protein